MVVNVYAPNSGDGFAKASKRAAWDAAFLAFARALAETGGQTLTWPAPPGAVFRASAPPPPPWEKFAGGRIVFCGDFNVTPSLALDVWPDFWRTQRRLAGTSPAELAAFAELLRRTPLRDAWRERNPAARGVTYYADNGGGGRPLAARFDATLVGEAAHALVADARTLEEGAPRGDHLPLLLDVRIPADAAAAAAAAASSSSSSSSAAAAATM